MDPLKEKLTRLGEAVAHGSDRLARPEQVLALARQRLVRPSRVDRGASYRRVAFVMACGVLMVALGFSVTSLYRGLTDRPLTFDVHSRDGKELRAGDWVAAESGPLDVRFSDGSTISMDAGAGLRVVDPSERGADVVVERGRALVDVVHRTKTRWTVRAGPFEVRVTGTRFNVDWDPATQEFELVLHEGSVWVVGPAETPPRRVIAGETLQVQRNHDGAGFAYVQRTSSREPPVAQAKQPQEPAALPDAAVHTPPEAGTAPSTEPRASAEELWKIADSARLSGNAAAARRALMRLRSDHGVRGHTAFLLGRIAADQSGQPREAIKWFETYLSEAPGGSLVEQALGRLVELNHGLHAAAARKYARQYLQRYPNGGHAVLARRVASAHSGD